MPDTTAIHEDADAQNAALLAQHVQPKSDREIMMEEMAARIAGERGEAESKAATNDDDPDKETGHNADAAATQQQTPASTTNDTQIAAQLAQDDRPSAIDIATEGKRTVKLKIDGEEREVSLENMYRNFQKAEAADKRLSEATRLLEEAKKVNAAAPAPASTESTATTEAKPPAEAKKKLLAALFSGDEQAADAALDELLVTGRPQPMATPTPDPEQFAREVAPAIKQQLDIDSALSAFRAEYPDVVADPYLEQKAADATKAALAEGKSFAEALKIGGDQTRDWIRAIAGVPAPGKPTTTDTMTERLTRKQTATSDQVVGASAKLTPQPEKEESREDYLAEMRKLRGQPPVG
ncbi:MAG: hypothetical protein ACRDAM_20535 [Casimicrobium sp.]